MNPTPTSKNKLETLASRRKAVERVIKNVSQKLDESLTMDEMAHMAYMSPFHFNRVFHQITGLPPTQFLYAMRLEKAKRLLLTTKLNVSDICFSVGYNSLGTFTSRFTELVGISPLGYRRLARRIRSHDWDTLFREAGRPTGDQTSKSSLKGNVIAPGDFEGLIFIGLFSRMIPQSQPVSGTMLTRGGPFYLHSLPIGKYNLLSAALPRSPDPLEYLLPDLTKLLVATYAIPVEIKNRTAENHVEIRLRPAAITDPPILLALPNLLINGIN